jgi:hypothetical protein
MHDSKMRLEAERSLAFAENCGEWVETPAEMAAVLQLERQAMAMLTEAGHANWAMSLQPRFRDILVLVAPEARPLPTRSLGEQPSQSGAMTITDMTTWHRMSLSPDQPPSPSPPKHSSAGKRRAKRADQPSITPAVVNKVLGMPAHEAVEFLVRHLATCRRGQPAKSVARPHRPARSPWRHSMRTNSPG